MTFGKGPLSPDDRAVLIDAYMSDIKALGYAGFDAFCVDPSTLHSPVREGNWAVASYDLGIIRDYVLKGFASICPMLEEAGRSLRPYDYVEFLDRHKHNASARWQRRLMRFYRIRYAWIVPTSSLSHVKGMTVFMRGKGADVDARFHDTRDEVHLKSIHFFEALEASGPVIPEEYAKTLQRAGPLTQREEECLRWAAAGKTNGEIAVILGISENTVRYHFKNILSKLGASSRAQAIAMVGHTLSASG